MYASQVGRSSEEKAEFFITLGKELDKTSTSEELIVCGDFSGHVGTRCDGFPEVHGGYGFGSRNAEGEMLLEFALAYDLVLANTSEGFN